MKKIVVGLGLVMAAVSGFSAEVINSGSSVNIKTSGCGLVVTNAKVENYGKGQAEVKMNIKNNTDNMVTIQSAISDVDTKTELHHFVMQNGKHVMKPVAEIDVPSHKTDKLGFHKTHVMLIGVKNAPLKVGNTVDLTLLEKGNCRIPVHATVVK
ncbi:MULTISPECIES: copper chaperone PCu(A)C [unclassified Francisella]|uniref:copper chaperone PCu(A)C n=1 Tax=unclassified Francisella TaxID=2610885 RepID=UPI002E3167EB|nr:MULTISPECIES: copper chaperone PCu(A)C [unclassified Francisella]MED7820253.1 copper chaperone PCu(A)C [Francisella sp. 19S2-4]MED7831088.1 copper chaperone PCu(A)C [Francisella sp. 19S2-10]